jgi:hypothetical protein
MPDYVDYTTVPHLANVELGTAGMEWPASTGPVTFTLEHLADAVTAANEDPHIQVPRVKLGHRSEVNGELLTIDPFRELGDAAPAFGRVVNLRTENDGAVLVGDFVEVPEWLATAMPSAYPNRSGDWFLDVETEGGKRYLLVLAAMSLLGTALPAVTDLEDLERFIEGGPDALARTVTARGADVPAAETSVSVDRIRRAFNFEWATDPDSVEGIDTYWWWARDIRVDPAEVIADDDEGNLWRVPFATDGEEEIDFQEPERVREVYVPVATDAGERELHRTAIPKPGQRVLATNLGRPAKDAPAAVQGAAGRSEPNEEEAIVPPTTLTPEQFSRLRDLPEDATEDQINAALASETPETPDEQPESPEQTPGGEPDGGEEAQPDEQPAASVAAERGTVVDRDAFAQLQADAKAGQEARQEQLAAERTQLIETAVSKGKFPRSAAASYRAQLDKGGEIEAQTRAFIEGLPENTIPVEETGGSADAAETSQTTGWFPQLAGKEA